MKKNLKSIKRMKKYEESDKNINIFGFEFVYNNKDKCKMIIDMKNMK